MMKDLEELFDEKNGKPVIGFNWLQNKIVLSQPEITKIKNIIL